jgi:hypothetical protein
VSCTQVNKIYTNSYSHLGKQSAQHFNPHRQNNFKKKKKKKERKTKQNKEKD